MSNGEVCGIGVFRRVGDSDSQNRGYERLSWGEKTKYLLELLRKWLELYCLELVAESGIFKLRSDTEAVYHETVPTCFSSSDRFSQCLLKF